MGFFRRRNRPLSSRHGSKEPSAAARGCLSLFLIVWGLGFGGGGVAALVSGAGPDEWGPWLRYLFAAPFVIGGLAAIVFGLAIALGVPIRRAKDRFRPGTAEPGPRTLRAAHRRGCALFFLVPFTGIWVTVTATMFAMSETGGGPPWFFSAIFGLVALALVAATAHQLLALTNPRAEVDIETGEVPLRPVATLPWRLVGTTSRLSTLTIELIGREEASYTRGTDRVTDRHEFYRRTLSRTEDVLASPRGELELRLPECGVPTFEGRSNKIVWLLRFSAPIRRWPDVNDEIEIPVGPGIERGPM